MSRKVQTRANTDNIKKAINTLNLNKKSIIAFDIQPFIAYIMYESGCTYAEIGETLGISRQAANHLYNKGKEAI